MVWYLLGIEAVAATIPWPVEKQIPVMIKKEKVYINLKNNIECHYKKPSRLTDH